MRIKIRYSQIFFSMILIIIICDCYGFRLFSLEDDIYKAISLVVVCFLLLICFFHKEILNLCKEFKNVSCYFIILFAFLLFEYAYIKSIYGNQQTFYEFANYNKNYIFILMTLPLIYIFLVNDGIEAVMNSIIILVTFTLGIMLLYAFFYNWQEIELFNISRYAKIITRNSRMRIWDLSSLEGLAVIYGTYRFLCDMRKKILYLFQVAICVIALVYVEQTRMMVIALAICILFMVIAKPCKTASGILTKGIIVFIVCIVGFSFAIPRLITSFSRGVSVSYRLIEIQFAYNLLHNQGLFGMGIIATRLQKYLFYHGIYSNVSLDDIGIIGYIAQAGIWSIGLYFFPMVRMVWILLHGQKNEFRIFLWSIYLYLLITSATLLIIDRQRILMWPFCLALFEFYDRKFGQKSGEDARQ